MNSFSYNSGNLFTLSLNKNRFYFFIKHAAGQYELISAMVPTHHEFSG